MPEPTAEAWAQIRHDYENTDRPIVDICFEHEITAPMLRYRVKVWDWKRRKPFVPRNGGPPAVFSPPPIRTRIGASRRPGTGSANGGEGSGVGGDEFAPALPPTPPAFAIASAGDPPHRHSAPETRVNALMAGGGKEEEASIVPRLQSAVARVLPAIDATVAQLATGLPPREMEQAGRTLSSLTRALRELNALLAQHNAQPDRQCDCDDDDMPKDIDEFRLELTRRIRSIIEAGGPAENAEQAQLDGPAPA